MSRFDGSDRPERNEMTVDKSAATPEEQQDRANTGTIASQDKREKFVVLAEKRVGNAITVISRIGNLANRNAYEFEDRDVRKIVKALDDEVSNVKARFAASKDRRTGTTFKL